MMRGFSLLEVIIALAILALLTVAILPSLTSFNATIDTSMKTVANIVIQIFIQQHNYKNISRHYCCDNIREVFTNLYVP